MYNKISKQIKKYNSIIDALNYMGSEGWETLRHIVLLITLIQLSIMC